MDIRKPTGGQVKRVGPVVRKTAPISRQAEARQKNKKKKMLVRSIIGLAVFVLIIIFLNLAAFRIDNVDVSGAYLDTDAERVSDATKKYLATKHFFIIPENNIFIASEARIKDVLLEQFPELSDVKLYKSGLHTLGVSVTEREPFFKVEGYDRVYVDKEGMVFEMRRRASSTLPIREVTLALSGDERPLPIDFTQNVGKKLDAKLIEHVVSGVDILNKKTLHVAGIIVYPYGDIEYVIEGGGRIRTNIHDDLSEAIAVFSSAKKIEPLRTAIVQKTTIDYIDLRFGNKVFYKLR